MSLLDSDSFPHKCTIARIVRTIDSFGGNLFGVTIEQTDVPCWQQKAGMSQGKFADKPQLESSTTVFFLTDPGVTERHLILITERNGVATANLDISDPANPDTLKVVGYGDPDASVGYGVLWSVTCDNASGNTQ